MPDTPKPANEPPPDPDAELVAYLDGELDDDGARAVEAKLALDPAARARAAALRKTYDLLDYLPRPEPSPTFASRTLTRLDAAPASGPVTARPRRAGWVAALGWVIAVAVAGGVGYVGHLVARPHLEAVAPTKPTSEQVRLLERLPLLLGVDDLDFLRRLDDPDLFGEPDGDPGPPPVSVAPADAFTTAELELLEDLFKRFPPARQEQLRRLDDELQAVESPARDRLFAALERYAVWLDRLPDGYRKEVLSAPAAPERLEAVRRVKARLWRESLPAPARQKLADADPAERDRLLGEWRQQDAARRQMWHEARRRWADAPTERKPWPFDSDDLTRRVNEFADRALRPRLRADDVRELDDRRAAASGGGWLAWWMYGYTVRRLADAHPYLPEAAAGKPMVTTVADLPPGLANRLGQGQAAPGKAARKALQNAPQHGKWPDFAELVAREARDLRVTVPRPLGPCRPGEFKPEVNTFVTDQLVPKLSAEDREELARQEGRWPEYPRKMIELATKADLSIPGATLPGSPKKWAELYDPPRRAKK